MFRYWLNQDNSKIQLINLASLTFLDFDVMFNQRSYRSELRSCVKVEVAVPGSSSLIVRMVSVDVKLH